jgi:hypothetical protein
MILKYIYVIFITAMKTKAFEDSVTIDKKGVD